MLSTSKPVHIRRAVTGHRTTRNRCQLKSIAAQFDRRWTIICIECNPFQNDGARPILKIQILCLYVTLDGITQQL